MTGQVGLGDPCRIGSAMRWGTGIHCEAGCRNPVCGGVQESHCVVGYRDPQWGGVGFRDPLQRAYRPAMQPFKVA